MNGNTIVHLCWTFLESIDNSIIVFNITMTIIVCIVNDCIILILIPYSDIVYDMWCSWGWD